VDGGLDRISLRTVGEDTGKPHRTAHADGGVDEARGWLVRGEAGVPAIDWRSTRASGQGRRRHGRMHCRGTGRGMKRRGRLEAGQQRTA
jgi:hypothetical protein